MPDMAMKEPSFTIGIEEEYLLVDRTTRDLAQEPPPALLAKCEEALRGQVSALFILVSGILGAGLGPVVVGAATDFVFNDDSRVRASMALVSLIR